MKRAFYILFLLLVATTADAALTVNNIPRVKTTTPSIQDSALSDDGTNVSSSRTVIPAATDGAALGTVSKMWADLFLASGAVLNFNNGDVTLTHSLNTLTLGGGDLAIGANNITITGSLASTGSRVLKGWFTDLDVTNTITGSISGNAATATALAANGGNCSAGSAPLGVDASGAAESCTDYEEDLANEAGLETAVGGANVIVSTEIDTFSELDAIVADQTLVHSGSNIATATALAADPANCSAGSLAAGVTAAGVAEGCVDVWTEAENTAAGYGTGDVTDVGDCAGSACFTGTSGTTLTFKGATSGTTTLAPTAIAGTTALTLPAETGTVCSTGSVCSGYAPLVSPSFTTPDIGTATGTGLTLSGLTASELLATNGTKGLVSLAVATYPSLTELSYVKGLTSAVQTQLNLKAPLASPTFTGTVTVPADSIDDDDISNSADVMSGSFGITIDGGGSAISTGVKGYIEIPYAMTIDAVTVLLDQSGSIVVDVWKDTYANYPPTDADSITASAPPTVTTATKSQDTTLTGWTTSVSAGDIIGFNVDSITTATRAHLIISGNKL